MDRVRIPAAILVGAIWTVAFLESVITQDFIALEITTPVVMITAGAVFTLRNGRNGNGK